MDVKLGVKQWVDSGSLLHVDDIYVKRLFLAADHVLVQEGGEAKFLATYVTDETWMTHCMKLQLAL